MPPQKPVPSAAALTGELRALANVRGVFVGQDVYAHGKDDRLSSAALAELRVDLGVRIAYAATSGQVAGAVAQTNLMDYRDKKASVCVGPPLGSVEVCLVGEEEAMGTPTPSGKVCFCSLCCLLWSWASANDGLQVVVKGPAVVDGKAELDAPARIDTDHTLILL